MRVLKALGLGFLLLVGLLVVAGIIGAAMNGTTNAKGKGPAVHRLIVARLTHDTFADVQDHPNLYKGNLVRWTCNIANFLGSDPNDSSHADVGCWEYQGAYEGGRADGEVMLNVPTVVNMNRMHSGDDVQVMGTVDVPFEGTNAFGGTVTTAQLDVRSIKDWGRDANATP